jgi:excisionase family DNA binding protein
MAKSDDELISVPQAAALLKVTPQRVRDYIKTGRLPHQLIGRFFAVKRGDVRRFERREPGRPAGK